MRNAARPVTPEIFRSLDEGEGEWRLKKRVHYLPVFTAVFIIVSLFISYGVSVLSGNVEPDFPFISHTAVEAPERCIFAQLINIGAFLLGANVYVRFLEQRELYRCGSHPARGTAKDRRLTLTSLVIGWLTAFSISVVANFQVTDMRPVHYTAAALVFLLGLTYCWIQTAISLRHGPCDCVTVLQVFSSTVLTTCLVTFIVSKTILKVKEARGEGTKEKELRVEYLMSTIAEWLTAIALLVFILTFSPSFSSLTLQGPRVIVPERTYRTPQGNTHHTSVTRNGNPPV